MSEAHAEITLRLEGSRAERGVSLSDFESFIDSFLAALRDFDRDGRGAPTRKSGHPARRGAAVTAFRLVHFEPGSGIATIEPQTLTPSGEEELPFDVVPIALENLQALVADVAADKEISKPVTGALAKACRALGNDGSIQIDLPAHLGPRSVRIDLPRLERLERLNHLAPQSPHEVRSVSGRLHLVDVEPDRVAIRSSNGVDWISSYPAELETRITRLVGRIVWAEGSGWLTSPRRGTMMIDRIEAVDRTEQSSVFTSDRVPDGNLLAHQGISGPQGTALLDAADWDSSTDDAYLAALTGT